MKYVFITGGVTSSLGKGVTAAALGCLLKARGYRVGLEKLDLYYNAEPAFLSPLEHGEAFITDDGHAVDLDLGNYERLVDVTLSGESCCTTGKIHRRLLERELRGDFHGSTIQAIPHVANEIKSTIESVAIRAGSDISIVEIGGTVGDMEAARNLLGIADAHTAEADPHTAHPVVRIPQDRVCQNDSRGATRMGGSGVRLMQGTLRELYGAEVVRERHANRYEVDPAYVPALEQKGFRLAGVSVEAGYPEAFVLEGHPFYAAVVYHPEYISRPGRAHPLFSHLVRSGLERK